MVLGLPLSTSAWADQLCPGDANDDGRVTVAELVQGIRNALDGCPSEFCNADVDCNGEVTISELVSSVSQALAGCGAGAGLIVDVGWLQRHLESPRVQPIDTRPTFGGEHIPGALPLSPYALATEVDGVPAQMVDATTAAEVLSGLGLRENSIAVVYGDAPEFDPARVVWALRYLGHRSVRYLDGGWDAWVAAGGKIANGDPTASSPATAYPSDRVIEGVRVDGAWILERLGEAPYDNPEIQIVDARSPAEYQDGFIPGAVHRQWTINLEDGRLLASNELEPFYSQLDRTRTTVVYCLAGWRASVAWLVLTELGFEDVRVYDGSWFEWGDSERGFPIAMPAPFDADEVTTDCRLSNKGTPGSTGSDLVRARLTLINNTGVAITAVAPTALSVTGADIDVRATPAGRRMIPEQAGAFFDWSFDLTGSVSVSVGATAIGPDGEFTVGPVDCGTIAGGD